MTKLELARRMLDASESEIWTDVIVPYLEQERLMQIELMTSMTNAEQLMRYAGAVQAIGNLLKLDVRAREVIQQEMNRREIELKKPVDNFSDLD